MLNSFVTRIFILFGNFALAAFVSQIWGTEGKGWVSLFLANIALLGIFCAIFSGSTVSYSAKQNAESLVLYHAYGWGIVLGVPIAFFFSKILYLSEYSGYFVGIVVLESLFYANHNIMISKRLYTHYHLLSLLQILIPVLIFGTIYFAEISLPVQTYFVFHGINLFFLFVLSLFILWRKINWEPIRFQWIIWKRMFHYGWQVQSGIFLNFLRMRFSYYLIGVMLNLSHLGIYSVAVAVTEALLSLSRSLSIVLYGEIIHSNKKRHQIALTKNTLRVVSVVSFSMVILLAFIPSWIYTWIFGEGFYAVKKLVLILLPGVFCDSLANIIANYFAGIHKIRVNNYRVIIGFSLTLIFSFLWIPRLGVVGAALAMSIAYTVSALFLLVSFYQRTDFQISDFFLTKKQIRWLKRFLLRKD